MKYSESEVDMSEVDIPELLYKYRTWNNDDHRKVLISQEVFFSPPSWFDDKKDCRVYRKYDYTDEETFDIYFKWLSRDNPSIDLREIGFQAIVYTQNTPLRNPEYLEEFKKREFEQIDTKVGILSLTESNDNKDMWNSYSNHGNGICIGFDGRKIMSIIRSYGKIHYTDELPQIILGEKFGIQIWKQMFNKETHWSYEQEHRFRKFSIDGLTMNERVVQLSKGCFKEVVFGWHLSPEDRNEIIAVCQRNMLNVTYLQANSIDDIITIEKCNV